MEDILSRLRIQRVRRIIKPISATQGSCGIKGICLAPLRVGQVASFALRVLSSV
jgi:hypothetical protein